MSLLDILKQFKPLVEPFIPPTITRSDTGPTSQQAISQGIASPIAPLSIKSPTPASTPWLSPPMENPVDNAWSSVPKVKPIYSASFYHSMNPAETRENTDGTGSLGVKVKFGDVAISDRTRLDELKQKAQNGQFEYITVPKLKDVWTPNGYGVFRIADVTAATSTKNHLDFASDNPLGTKAYGITDFEKRIGNNNFEIEETSSTKTSQSTAPQDLFKPPTSEVPNILGQISPTSQSTPPTDLNINMLNNFQTGVGALGKLANSVIEGTAVGLIRLPERLVLSANEFVNQTIKGKNAELPTPSPDGKYVPTTIQQDMLRAFDDYVNGTPWWTIPLAIISAGLDLTIAGGAVKSAVGALARRGVDKVIVSALDEMKLTEYATEAEQKAVYWRKSHELSGARNKLNPTVAETEAVKKLENANAIITKAREAGRLNNPIARAAQKLQQPVSGLYKTDYSQPLAEAKGLLTEQAGTQPTQPFQPYKKPSFGLSTREVPEKPIVKPFEATVYRGTVAGKGDKGLGEFYTTDKSQADFYNKYKTQKLGTPGTVVSEKIKLENPLYINGASGFDAFEEMSTKVPELKTVIKTMNSDVSDIAMDNAIVKGEQLIKQYAEKSGYDGVVFENGSMIIKTKPLAQENLLFVKSLFKDTAARGIKTKEGLVLQGGNLDTHIADIRQKLTARGYKEVGGIGLEDLENPLVKDGAELNFEKGKKAINVYMRTDGKRTAITFDETLMDTEGKLHIGDNYVPQEIKDLYIATQPQVKPISAPGAVAKGISKVAPEEKVLSDIFKQEYQALQTEGRLNLANDIKNLGGIKVSGGIEKEIMESVPTHLLNKNGQGLDEMAQELHSQGFANIVDGDSLRAELEKMYAQKVEPLVGKDPTKKTPEFQSLPDDMKSRITTFFRPSRKLESRAFQLLGNKDTTIPMLRNTFGEWAKQGVETIIEPYGGAFTVGTHGLNDAIKSGLKNFYSNVFDKEKYLIVKAVQDGQLAGAKGAIDDAVKRFSDTVYKYSDGDTKVRGVLDGFFKEYPTANIGSREFYSYISKQPIGSQVTVYQDDYEAWRNVFDRAYKDLFVKEPENLRDAAMTSFLKRIESRAGELITRNGFNSYFNKIYGDRGMIAGLEDMMKSFQLAKEYGTRINIYNKDGAEFIKSINAESLGVDPKKTGYYFDPPYVKSASVYDNAQQLDNFSSGYNLATSHENAFLEAKQGAKILLTNDVETEYIGEMEQRLKNPGLFAYREGVTPTSLITDASTKPVIDQYLKTAEKVGGEREEVALVKAMQIEKNLSNLTFATIRKNLGIENIKKATDEKLAQFLTFLQKLQPGDKLLTPLQIKASADLVKEGDFLDPINLVTQRDFINKFREQVEIMTGLPERWISNEMFPTVTLKQGHPLVTKIVDNADDLMRVAEKNTEGRDERFEKMITVAEKSRELPLLERFKRGVTPQNKEIFQALGGFQVQLTKEEVATVAYLKNFFAKVRDDLKLVKYRKYYVTHMEKPLMEKIATNGLKNTISEILKGDAYEKTRIPLNIMLELDNIIGSEKFFKFALERKGGLDPTTNIRKIIHDYGQLYETKMALDKILPEAQMITRLLLQPRTAMWQQNYLKNLKGRGLDYNFRNGKMSWLPVVADRINDASYIQFLGLNWKSPIKNELAGLTNNFIMSSIDKFVVGQVRFFHSPVKSIRIMKEYGLLEGMFYDYAVSLVGKIGRTLRWSLVGQKIGEYHVRTSLAMGELTKAEWESGVLSPARVRVLRDLIDETHGVFTKTTSPLAVQHWLGRSALLMNRWRLTNFNITMKSARLAKAEIKGGNYTGRGSRMFIKMLFMYGTMMYFYIKLRESGVKWAADIVRSMAQNIDGMVVLFTTNEIERMATDFPVIQDARALFKNIQQFAHYLGVPGIEEPSDWKFQPGLEDLYIAPVNTIKQLMGGNNTSVDDAWDTAKKSRSVDEVWSGATKSKTIDEVWK